MALDATRCSSTRATCSTTTVRVFHRHHCRWRAAGCAATRDNNRMVRWCSSASIMILYYHGRAIPRLVCITGSGSGGGATFSSVSDPCNGRGYHNPRLLLKGRRDEYNGRWCPVIAVARGNIRLRRRAPPRLISVWVALMALWFILKSRDVGYHWMMSVIPWRDYRSKPRSSSTRSSRITTLRVGNNRRNHWLRHTNHILGHEPGRIFPVRHSRVTLRARDNGRND